MINKTDLPAAWDLEQEPAAVRISARTGAGLGELGTRLERTLVPNPPPDGAAVPFTPELCDAVEESLRLALAGQHQQARERLRHIIPCR